MWIYFKKKNGRSGEKLMKDADQKRAGTAFVKRWQDRGNE